MYVYMILVGSHCEPVRHVLSGPLPWVWGRGGGEGERRGGERRGRGEMSGERGEEIIKDILSIPTPASSITGYKVNTHKHYRSIGSLGVCDIHTYVWEGVYNDPLIWRNVYQLTFIRTGRAHNHIIVFVLWFSPFPANIIQMAKVTHTGWVIVNHTVTRSYSMTTPTSHILLKPKL